MIKSKYFRSQQNQSSSHKISSGGNIANIDENTIREYCRKIIKEEMEKTQHSRSSQKSIHSSTQSNHTTYNVYREKYYRQATSEMLRGIVNSPLDGMDFKSHAMENTMKKISNSIIYSILSKI